MFYFNWFSPPYNVHLCMVSSRPLRWQCWSAHAWEYHVSSISISRALKIPAPSERALDSQKDPSALHKKWRCAASSGSRAELLLLLTLVHGFYPSLWIVHWWCAASSGSRAKLIFEERGNGSWRRTPPPTVSTPRAWIGEVHSVKSKWKYEYKYTYKCN